MTEERMFLQPPCNVERSLCHLALTEIKQEHEQEEVGQTMQDMLFLTRWLAPLTRRNVSRATCGAKFYYRFAGQVAFPCTGQVSWLLATNAACPTFPSQPLKPYSSEVLDSGILSRYPRISISRICTRTGAHQLQ